MKAIITSFNSRNYLQALTVMMLLVFGLTGNGQTNSQSAEAEEHMLTFNLTYEGGFAKMLFPETSSGQYYYAIRTQERKLISSNTNGEYQYWLKRHLAKIASPNRSVNSEPFSYQETYFDITWGGPIPENEKDCYRFAIRQLFHYILASNQGQPSFVEVWKEVLGSGILANSTIDWIYTGSNPPAGLLADTWYPAFLYNITVGLSNGPNPVYTTSYNLTTTWSTDTLGGASPNYNLAKVHEHELTHNVGESTSAQYDSITGICSFAENGPLIGDHTIVDGSGAIVLNNPAYQTSSQLYALFTGGDVHAQFLFTTDTVQKRHATLPWTGNISHVDQITYENGLSGDMVPTYPYLGLPVPMKPSWQSLRRLETIGYTLENMVLPGTDFSVDNQNPNAGQTINFTDISSENPTEWYWEFGDGNTSNLQNPPHSYAFPGTYTVALTATNTCGYTVETKTNYITVNDSLLISASATPDSVCPGGEVQLYCTPSGGSGNYTYSWSSSPSGFSSTLQNPLAYPAVTTTYTVEVNDGNETAADSVVVTVWDTPDPTITGDTVICDGDSSLLDSGPGYSTYLWSTGETTQTITVFVAGDYSVTVTNSNGCEGDDLITLVVNSLPTPQITGDDEVCKNSDGTYSVGTFSTYSWSIDPASAGTIISGQGTNSIVVNWTASGDVLIDVTNSNSCTGSDVFTVTVNESPTANAGPDQSIPYNTSTFLDGSASGGDGSYDYSWTPVSMVIDPADPGTETVNLTAPQTFTLDVTDGNGCSSPSDDVFIDVTGGPLGLAPTATPDVTCGDTEVQLEANAYGGSGNYTYSWTSDPPGFTSTEENPTDTPSETTTYICEVDDGDTTATDSVVVTVYDPVIANAGPDIGLEIGQSAQFEGSFTGGSDDVSILWEGVNNSIPIDDPTVLDPLVGPFAEIDIYYFVLTVTDNSTGCVSTDTMLVDVITGVNELVKDDISIYPNPCSTSVTVEVAKGKEFSLTIVNTYGQIVFVVPRVNDRYVVNTADYPKGLYFFVLRNANERITKKVIVR